jgi:hypothetical protein
MTMRTSPVRFVRLVGPGPSGKRIGSFEGPLLTEFSIRVPLDWEYVYAEIEDETGRRAWTHNLLVS